MLRRSSGKPKIVSAAITYPGKRNEWTCVPPMVAPTHAVIVPIYKGEEEAAALKDDVDGMVAALRGAGAGVDTGAGTERLTIGWLAGGLLGTSSAAPIGRRFFSSRIKASRRRPSRSPSIPALSAL